MTHTEKLVAALRATLAEHVWDGTVLDLSAYTDERIIEVVAMHRAVRRIRALLADLLVTDEWLATTERGIKVARPSDLIT